MIVHYDERKKTPFFPCGRAFEGARLVQNHGLHRDKLGGGLTYLCADSYD